MAGLLGLADWPLPWGRSTRTSGHQMRSMDLLNQTLKESKLQAQRDVQSQELDKEKQLDDRQKHLDDRQKQLDSMQQQMKLQQQQQLIF